MKASLLALVVNVGIFSLVPLLSALKPPGRGSRPPIPVELIPVEPRVRDLRPPKARPLDHKPPPPLLHPPKPRVVVPPLRVSPLPRLLRLAKLDLADNLSASQVDLAVPPVIQEAPEEGEYEEPSVDPVEPPRKTRHVHPVYPRWAQQRGVEGKVRARLLVDEKGEVKAVKILSVEGHRSFGRAAADALRRWRFQPARVRGLPVARWCETWVNFRLR